MMNGIERLCSAIGYPDRVQPGSDRFDMFVDGAKVTAVIDSGRLVLSRILANSDELGEGELLRLAGFAAGRVLKEEATLSWDPTLDALILWQAVSEDGDSSHFRMFFDVFCASCDWWSARVSECGRQGGAIPEMVILP